MGLIKITDDLYINNDMRGWALGKNQPKWHESIYYRWIHMWSRCRNPEHPRYNSYKDCLIDERYKKLSNYANDIQLLEDFDLLKENPSKYDIDKDKIDPNNRCYYFEHLSIITRSENSKEAVNRNNTFKGDNNPSPSKPIIAIHVDGKCIKLYKSYKDANIKRGVLRACINKEYCKRKNVYKNFRWYKINYKHNKVYRIKGGDE